VNVEEVVSAFPITIELALGVKEVTEAVVEPAEELPVEVDGLVVETPLSSYIEIEPVTEEENAAVIVSAPVLAAVAYQM
jgi:hypothetical protein